MKLKDSAEFYNDFWKLQKSERNKKKITESEIRKDYLQDRFVVISPGRKWKVNKSENVPAGATCQFCPENIKKEGVIEESKEGGKWQIKVVGNKFPVFSAANSKALGFQEIIIETPKHGFHFADFSLYEIEEIIKIYISRAMVLSKEKNVNYILIFKNSGKEAGASVAHEHSQVFATAITPVFISDKLAKEADYEKEHKNCVYCDIAEYESAGPRLVYKDKNFIVYCPYASFFAYEIAVMPLRHIGRIAELTADEKISLAKILKSATRGIAGLGLSYNFYFHTLPKIKGCHLYFKFQPRSGIWAGFELGAELVINSMPPEDAAEHYKKFF